jgi:hypothetical protein
MLNVLTALPPAVYRTSGSDPKFPIRIALLTLTELSPKKKQTFVFYLLILPSAGNKSSFFSSPVLVLP